MGKVSVDGNVVDKPGHFVVADSKIKLDQDEQFVSRAALKLKSVADKLGLDFASKVVLDIGSSTGGFTDFALSRGAKRVIAVDVGTDQMHPKLRNHPKVELHEKTDIRNFQLDDRGVSSLDEVRVLQGAPQTRRIDDTSSAERSEKREIRRNRKPDIILIDVSFISSREILPSVVKSLATSDTQIILMLKPQFETGARVKNAGVIKNDTERRKILKDFETWAKRLFVIEQKADSEVAGAKGNLERFYLLRKIRSA